MTQALIRCELVNKCDMINYIILFIIIKCKIKCSALVHLGVPDTYLYWGHLPNGRIRYRLLGQASKDIYKIPIGLLVEIC